jgi:hypothetical protein
MSKRFKFWEKDNAHSMPKQRLNLTVDSNLVKLARMQGINISALLEQILRGNSIVSAPFRGFDSGSNPDRSIRGALNP